MGWPGGEEFQPGSGIQGDLSKLFFGYVHRDTFSLRLRIFVENRKTFGLSLSRNIQLISGYYFFEDSYFKNVTRRKLRLILSLAELVEYKHCFESGPS